MVRAARRWAPFNFSAVSLADISNLISSLHWPEHANTLDPQVYPGLKELLPLIKYIDCFAELCVFTRWPEGEPALETIPLAAALEFPQV